MIILNEPISTWISLAAFLISLSALFLALRKRKHNVRTVLASKIAEIKTLYGEELRIIVEVLEKNDRLVDLIKKSFPEIESRERMKLLRKNHESLAGLKSKVEKIYRGLSKEETKTTDPRVLSAMAVENDGIMKHLEKVKKNLVNTARNIVTIINRQPKTKQPVKLRAHDKKRSKKQNTVRKKI